MFSSDFIFRQQENLVDNQKCQAGFRPLCNKILLSNLKLDNYLCFSLFYFQMRAYRYGTYSAIFGSGASLLYNQTLLPGLLFGISAGTIAGFVQNTKEKLDKEN